MPKPIFDESDPTKGDNGSGMHVSVTFGKNLLPQQTIQIFSMIQMMLILN